MIEVPVYNQEGAEVGKLSVDEAKLGGEVNNALLKQAIVYYHAAQRQGTVKTKNRKLVAGSTRKIYKQKGTGNARQGTIRQPVRVGGGHAKHKLPKDWRQGFTIKARRLARDHALLAKLQSGQVKLVESLELSEPKTKVMAKVYKSLGIDRSCVVATDSHNEQVYRAARNIDRTTVTTVSQINAWDIVRNRTVLMSKAGMESLLK